MLITFGSNKITYNRYYALSPPSPLLMKPFVPTRVLWRIPRSKSLDRTMVYHDWRIKNRIVWKFGDSNTIMDSIQKPVFTKVRKHRRKTKSFLKICSVRNVRVMFLKYNGQLLSFSSGRIEYYSTKNNCNCNGLLLLFYQVTCTRLLCSVTRSQNDSRGVHWILFQYLKNFV